MLLQPYYLALSFLPLQKLAFDSSQQVDGPGAPYRQSERGEIYVKIAKKLVEMVDLSAPHPIDTQLHTYSKEDACSMHAWTKSNKYLQSGPQGHAYPCFCTEEELDAKRKASEASGSAVSRLDYIASWL